MGLLGVAALLGFTAIAAPADPDTITTNEAVMSVDDNIRDWKISTMLKPSHGPTLDVWVCRDHLPVGSQTRTNLEAAVAEFNALLGVDVFGQVRNLPGTAIHPVMEPTGFTGVYVDFRALPSGAASMGAQGCGISLDKDPRKCNREYLRIDSTSFAAAMANPNEIYRAVAKRVFAHELAHGFGLGHPAPGEDDPQELVQNIRFDGASNHGDKFEFEGQAWPTTVGSAKDYAWMQHYYPSSNLGNLATDELIVHPIMSLALSEDVFAELTFWRGYTRGQIENWDNWNQTSVYWSSADNLFLRCSDDATEHDWMARFSEVSNNTTDTRFSVGYQLATDAQATSWVTLTERGNIPSHVAGTEFNQKTYKGDFTLDTTNTGINPTTMTNGMQRKLRFVADLDDDLSERSENNNILEANICFYKEKNRCRSCAQATQGNLPSGEPCFEDDECQTGFCEVVYGEAGFQKECNEAKCDECTFDSDPTDATCDNTPLPNGNPGTCNEPELCMAGQCTNPGTCSGGVCALDCSASAPAAINSCAPGFTAVGYCPLEASCAGGQYNCDCRL